MASAESQKPICPVCQQTDQVKTMQAAYSTGVARCAPPDMPTRNISMMKPLVISGILVGICVFLIVTFIGGMENGVPRISSVHSRHSHAYFHRLCTCKFLYGLSTHRPW